RNVTGVQTCALPISAKCKVTIRCGSVGTSTSLPSESVTVRVSPTADDAAVSEFLVFSALLMLSAEEPSVVPSEEHPVTINAPAVSKDTSASLREEILEIDI